MNFTTTCKYCGAKHSLSEEMLKSGAAIVCPQCGKASDNAVKNAAGAGPKRPEEGVKPWEYKDGLNSEQHLAATYDGAAGAVLLLAGAGCGKTRTLIARTLFLLQHKHANPERMVLLTFTRRAAKEIIDRIEQEMPGVSKLATIGTFHAFCLNIMHRYPSFFNMDAMKIMDQSDQETCLRRILRQIDAYIEDMHIETHFKMKERQMQSIFSYMGNTGMDIDQYYENHNLELDAKGLDLLKQGYNLYKKYKQENNYMDFDDILLNMANMLEQNADFRRIVQNNYDYLLVDEMQDTSPVQWRLIRALYPPCKLFCVGDDAQSIYSFRGADFESIHHFCEILPDSVILKLTENYRSTQQILDISNMLMEGSPYAYDKNLKAHNGQGERRPIMLNFDNDMEEANAISEMIVNRLQDGVPPNEIMVMLRSMHTGRFLEHSLRTYGIMYRVIGGMSFLQAAHVKDVISILEALTIPHNELSWSRFLMLFPKLGFKTTEKHYEKIRSLENQKQVLQVMALSLNRTHPDLANFIAHFDIDRPPDDMLKEICTWLDDREILSSNYDKWNERKKDLEALLEISREYKTVNSFLESFKLDPDTSMNQIAKEKDKNAVTLITVHSAKGTEADVCFITRVQSGVYPSYHSETEAQIEEDRRVLYVAMTRAKKEMYLTTSQGQSIDWWCTPVEDSEFLTPQMQNLLKSGRCRVR